jgi:hypothetical protein
VNNRTATAICAGVAAISGVVTATLWLDLRSERQVVAGLHMELAASQERVAVAEARARTRFLPPGPPSASPVIATHSDAARTNLPQLLQDPQNRKARLTMLRTAFEQSFPGLVEALGLSREEADRLLDLLAETQLNRDSQASYVLTGDPQADQALIAKLRRNLEELQREQGDAIRAMLGGARYDLWQQYLPTRSVRVQANTYATALAQAGAPLDGRQIDGLVAVMLGEQKSLREDMVALGRTVDAANPASQEQARNALRNRQAASNQRILDAASPRLNTQQQLLLRAQLEQTDAIKEATDRTWERPRALP